MSKRLCINCKHMNDLGRQIVKSTPGHSFSSKDDDVCHHPDCYDNIKELDVVSGVMTISPVRLPGMNHLELNAELKCRLYESTRWVKMVRGLRKMVRS